MSEPIKLNLRLNQIRVIPQNGKAQEPVCWYLDGDPQMGCTKVHCNIQKQIKYCWKSEALWPTCSKCQPFIPY